MFFMSKKKGFTLIEMLVVVLIIGIIAAIAFPKYQIAVLKTRYTQLMVMGDALRKAQDAYYLVHGKYSLKINDLDITVPGDCTLTNNGGAVSCAARGLGTGCQRPDVRSVLPGRAGRPCGR